VLVAVDESPVSLRAAREAVRLFDALSPEYLVINVARGGPGRLFPAEFGAVEAMPGSQWDSWELEELAHHAVAAAAAEQAGLDHPEVIVEAGDPAACICSAAEGHHVDVVVVGSHDRGTLGRLLSPSVSAAVVRGTHLPVLVVSGESPVNP
jgi:nucleotide-binding universal stress UspA family protein